MEYVVWGTPKGAETWAEKIITSTADAQHRDKAIAWAQANGFTNVRVSVWHSGDRPDFAATINK